MRRDTRRRLLEVIESYPAKHGIFPSMRELAKAIGAASVSNIDFHIIQLVGQGFVIRPHYLPRAIRITEKGRRALAEGLDLNQGYRQV